jgi:hypothetical protein
MLDGWGMVKKTYVRYIYQCHNIVYARRLNFYQISGESKPHVEHKPTRTEMEGEDKKQNPVLF